MAVYQKLSDIGWFYHAPEKRSVSAPVKIPLMSQVPGLNDLSGVPEEETRKTLFKDTDTKYIRLAKMGGREDLLIFRENVPRPKQPMSYPRNDWFYLEDYQNEANQAEPKEPWEFRLPDYMVHDEARPFGHDYDYVNDPEHKVYWNKSIKKRRAAADLQSNKQIAAANERRLQDDVHFAQVPKTVPRNAQTDHSHYPAVPQLYDLSARPAMNKLLAYGYQNEWQQTRDDWYYRMRLEEESAAEKNKLSTGMREKVSNQSGQAYRPTWDEITGKKKKTSSKNRTVIAVDAKKPAEDKQPFKLSRFTKIGSKVDSYRTLPAVEVNK